jgi:hypothetical protein
MWHVKMFVKTPRARRIRLKRSYNEDMVLSAEQVDRMILFVRGQKVILDHDLAILYGVTTGNLNKAVKRNIERFPNDFMFQLTSQE